EILMYRLIQLTKTTSFLGTSQVTRPNDNGTCFHALSAGLFPVVSILMRRIALPLLLLGAGLALMQPCAGAPFQFEETGSLATVRRHHTATLLSNGKVLVAAGEGESGVVIQSAELYAPANGIWAETGSL